MDSTATEPLTLRSLRAKALRDGLTMVAKFAIIGLIFWGIGFNSNSDAAQQWIIFTMVIPALMIFLVVKYLVERQRLEVDAQPTD